QLLVHALQVSGDALEAVRISKVDDEVFYAELVLQSGKTVDSRASDAVAAALFAEVPVYTTEDVLEVAGIDLTEGDIAAELNIEQPEVQPAITEESVDEFREFLKDLTPEDFLTAEESDHGQPESDDPDDDQSEDDSDENRK